MILNEASIVKKSELSSNINISQHSFVAFMSQILSNVLMNRYFVQIALITQTLIIHCLTIF